MPVRIRSLILGATLMAGLGALSGCAPSSNDLQQLNQNQFVLRGMIASDRQQIDALQQQVRSLQGEIAQIQHTGAGVGASGGQIAALNKRIAKLESEVGALQAAMPTIPPAPGTTPGTTTGAATTGATTAGVAPPTPSAAPSELQPTWPSELEQELAAAKDQRGAGVALFRAGLTDMKSGRYPAAVLKFAQFQRKYPKSPLSEPAEYFAANALYEEGKFDRSILQFNDLVMRFPSGKYASQSLLREAQAFMKLNDKIDARLTLQKLLSDHPGTPQATAANTLMKQLAASAD